MKKHIYFSLLLMVVSISCNKDDAPYYKAPIIGRVEYEDPSFYPDYPFVKGDDIKVTAIFNKDLKYTVSTYDSTGNFIINNARTGTYIIKYSKEGYGTMSLFEVQHYGFDTLNLLPREIYKIPNLNVQIDTVHTNSDWGYTEYLVPYSLLDENDSIYSENTFIGMVYFFKIGDENVNYTNFDGYLYESRNFDSDFYPEKLLRIDEYSHEKFQNLESGTIIYFNLYLKSPYDFGFYNASKLMYEFPSIVKEGSKTFSITIL